ncbi:hypothetical protein [Nocardia sp. NPDC051570]|uniref:hypothetical protein n=1 Tax=Nocardia sp. NPDC051570 TaxID=3364324 RepID=UPI00379D41B8
MDKMRYLDYIARYNAGDHRGLVQNFYTNDIGLVVFGYTVAHGMAEMLEWLETIHLSVGETIVSEEVEFDEFGLEIWSRALEVLACHHDFDLFGGRMMRAGEIHLVPVFIHYLTHGDRIGRVLIEEGRGVRQVLRPAVPSHRLEQRRGQVVNGSRSERPRIAPAEPVLGRDFGARHS